MRHVILIAVIVAAVVGAGCGQNSAPTDEPEASASPQQEAEPIATEDFETGEVETLDPSQAEQEEKQAEDESH